MTAHRLDTYRLIAHILSASHEPSNSLLAKRLEQWTHWEQLVYHGSSHLLLPTIYKQLNHKGVLSLLPDDLQAYLEDLYQQNHTRNLELLQQIKALHALLRDAQIPHVFLKGTAVLIRAEQHDPSPRLVGDIDILVAPPQLQQAIELLTANGYTNTIGFYYKVTNFRHLDRQISKDGIAAVELHDALLRHPKQALLSAKTMLATAEECNGLPVPNRRMMALHAVLAYTINDQGYYYRSLSLKTWNDVQGLEVMTKPEMMHHLHSTKYGRWFLIWPLVINNVQPQLPQPVWPRLKAAYLRFKLNNTGYAKAVYRLKYALHYLRHRLWL